MSHFISDIRNKITKKTRGIVIINPNNPTGSLYPKYILEEIIKVAREFNLVIFSDEIYDRLLFDDLVHTSIASLNKNVPIVTFSGLSKSHMMAGFRIGWMIITGNKKKSSDYSCILYEDCDHTWTISSSNDLYPTCIPSAEEKNLFPGTTQSKVLNLIFFHKIKLIN